MQLQKIEVTCSKLSTNQLDALAYGIERFPSLSEISVLIDNGTQEREVLILHSGHLILKLATEALITAVSAISPNTLEKVW